MKLSVLVDNNTYIDTYFSAEPALSFFIEEENEKILFDCGFSDLFIKNARKMNIDPVYLDFLIFSHGHHDHTWGVDSLLREYIFAVLNHMTYKKPIVVAHPETFDSINYPGVGEIGSLISKEKISRHFPLNLTKVPFNITKNLIYLGEIPRVTDFEALSPIGKRNGKDDFLMDDTALCYNSSKGLVIITGCSHAGICNIVEYAKQLTGINEVYSIIGGLHLQNPPQKQIDGTIEYFSKLNMKSLYACHCTDLNSKIKLSSVANLKEVGVGLELEFN